MIPIISAKANDLRTSPPRKNKMVTTVKDSTINVNIDVDKELMEQSFADEPTLFQPPFSLPFQIQGKSES